MSVGTFLLDLEATGSLVVSGVSVHAFPCKVLVLVSRVIHENLNHILLSWYHSPEQYLKSQWRGTQSQLYCLFSSYGLLERGLRDRNLSFQASFFCLSFSRTHLGKTETQTAWVDKLLLQNYLKFFSRYVSFRYTA